MTAAPRTAAGWARSVFNFIMRYLFERDRDALDFAAQPVPASGTVGPRFGGGQFPACPRCPAAAVSLQTAQPSAPTLARSLACQRKSRRSGRRSGPIPGPCSPHLYASPRNRRRWRCWRGMSSRSDSASAADPACCRRGASRGLSRPLIYPARLVRGLSAAAPAAGACPARTPSVMNASHDTSSATRPTAASRGGLDCARRRRPSARPRATRTA